MHVGTEPEARQLGRGHRLDDHVRFRDRPPECVGQALTGNCCRPLTDHQHAPDLTRTETVEHHRRERLVGETNVETTVDVDELRTEGLP